MMDSYFQLFKDP